MGAVFLKLLHMSLAASGLVIAVMVLRLVLKRAPKAIHCALWALVALRLLLPFSVESSFSLIPEDVAEGEILSEWRDDYVGEVTILHDGSANYDAALAAGREQHYAGEQGYYVVTGEDGISAPETVETAVFPILGWVWLAGCAAMVGYAAVSYLRVRQRVRISLHLRDNIWRCESVDSPFILGFFSPKIYLPYSMDEAQTQYVIAHEEAHLRRRDHWWKPLGFLLLAVYWFNPLLWVAYLLLCRDIELACDEKVIRDMDASAKKAYSEALLSCSLPRRMVAACPLAFGEVGVKKRISSVLHYKKPAFWVMVIAIIACVAVAVCFLTNPKQTLDGEVYTYEKAGVLGNFTITLFEDGTFAYTEGMASSYLAEGKWQEVDNILTLTDNGDYGLVNHFVRDGDDLVFLAEDSSNFSYVEVQDGERFTYTMDVSIPIPQGDWDGMQTVVVPGYAIVGTPSPEDIFSRVDTSYPEEMLAYLCQADLWDDAIKEHPEILMPGNFDITAMFSQTPSDSDALDLAMARRAYLLMRLYPDEVFHVLWSYPDNNGGRINRDLHADEVSAIVSLSSHTEVIASPDSVERVAHQLGFLSSLDDKLFLHFSALGNELSSLYEDDNMAAQLFDTILSSPVDAAKPADYLEAHPQEHEVLLNNSEATLRYIFTEFLKGGQTEPRGQVMRTVLDELAPEAQLRLYTETGQAYFDEWMKGADQMASDHGLEWLEENQPALYLALQIRSEMYGHSSPAIPVSLSELEGAVWFTPEDIHDIEYMELAYADGQRFTLSSEEGYDYVGTCLSSATESWTPACPFDNVLFFHRADGVVGKILTSSDGCWMIKSNEKYYRVADWDDPAYEASKEKYFSYFVPVSEVSPAATPQLPNPLKLEVEVQQAACDAILASLSTGWWTAQELDPTKEAAAFTCFHQHIAGDALNLYGFGGYFSQDAQGNAADEWSNFAIVTLNKTTLDLIQVWWPGDGAYHDMSITENFPDDLAEAAIMISPDDYQSLQTALRKQAVKNMAPTHLE